MVCAVAARPTVLIAGLSLLLPLLAAAGARAAPGPAVSAVAVFPVENLSGGAVHLDGVRQFLIDSLTSRGITVLGDDRLDDFMRRHRVRYAAGVDSATAESLKRETGVGGIVFASVEFSSDDIPPKVALVARLVSTEATPVVEWADDVVMAGDDAPGLLDLGIVDDYATLLDRALHRLADSLVAYLKTGDPGATPKPASKFKPKMSYAAHALENGKTYSIAVLPFLNLSPRRNAGEILALLFVRHLSSFPQFRVFDSGVVRRELLSARIIMQEGPSISDADTVAALVEADLVLGGRVLSYLDVEGSGGRPHVEFSAVLIERKSRRLVWSSDSYNDGDDGVRFFGRGRSSTAHLMATQMVRLTAEMIAGSKH